ncbi:hypothetical protein [Caulobacter hibisci]|uniref:Uncharacterized protein n=1 Tax=Caulobacter hibisci TaxID=2035993 RepID=A0ABS0SSY7_9CAUL|nr:hypothetical protein [Caulobacter hibisci]MBI1682775.1 hypothetical protein [Caulobacter hibisci]
MNDIQKLALSTATAAMLALAAFVAVIPHGRAAGSGVSVQDAETSRTPH